MVTGGEVAVRVHLPGAYKGLTLTKATDIRLIFHIIRLISYPLLIAA